MTVQKLQQNEMDVIKKYHLVLSGTEACEDEADYRTYNWPAPIIQKPDVAREYIDHIGIIGATIQGISIGKEDWYGLDVDPEEFLKGTAKIKNEAINLRLLYIGILVIRTNVGNFEIEFPDMGTFLMTKNKVPMKCYEPLTEKDCDGNPDFDLDRVFDILKGDVILDFDVVSNSHAMNYGSGYFREYLEPDQKSFIDEVNFYLLSGRILRFYVSVCDSSFVVIDDNEKCCKITTKHLKECIVGRMHE